MSTISVHYLLAIFFAGAGFAAVFFPLGFAARLWLRRSDSLGTALENGQPASRPALDPDQAHQLVTRLHEAAMRMTHDVGEHSASMQDITRQLEKAEIDDESKAIEIVLHAVDRIAQANGQLTNQLTSAQKTIQEQSVLLEVQMADALTDPLTAIANRRAFDHELSRRYAEWQRQGTPVSLLMVDVDHFKRFNDQHGHLAGDEVLRGVATILTRSVREMDLVARYGGEEFSLILPSTDLKSAKSAADRVRKAVAQAEYPFEGQKLHVTASVGLAQVRGGEDIASLVRRADEALYASKNAGRNCTHFHNGTNCELIGEKEKLRPRTDAVAAHEPSIAPTHDSPTAPAVPKDETRGSTALQSSGHPAVKQPSGNIEAHIDPLTGFPTREVLRENLRRRIAEWRRLRVPLALVVIALDDHQRVEALGSKASDFAVDTIAKLLMAACRAMDFVVRSGEHQFTIMLPSCNLTNALVPAERVRKAVAACEKLKYQGSTVWFTVSAGVAEVTAEDDEDSLFQRAEAAIKEASAEGNCTFLHNGAVTEPALSSLGV